MRGHVHQPGTQHLAALLGRRDPHRHLELRPVHPAQEHDARLLGAGRQREALVRMVLGVEQ